MHDALDPFACAVYSFQDSAQCRGRCAHHETTKRTAISIKRCYIECSHLRRLPCVRRFRLMTT